MQTLLVTGAGGQLGHRVAELLLTSGRNRIVVGSRNPAKLEDLASLGAETRQVDFDDADLASSFTGVDRLLIVSTNAIDQPGKRLKQHQAAVAAAIQAGVKHVVYTSMPNPEPGSPIPFAPDHYQTEQALAASSLSWTILRNSWYAENFDLFLPQVLSSGKWFTSVGEGRTSYVTREDCAQAAAAALSSTSTTNAIHTITGPEALTNTDISRLVYEAYGKKAEVIPVTDEQLHQGLSAAGVPDSLASLLVAFDANTRSGRIEIVTDDVLKLTGRKPQTLREFFSTHSFN